MDEPIQSPSTSHIRTVQLAVESMTPDSFAPFGVLLGPADDRRPDYTAADSVGWRAPLMIAGTPELVAVRTNWVGLVFSKLERHFNVTQAFFPLAGVPAAIAVAEPTGVTDPRDVPSPERLRAFAVVPGVAYVLGTGTWHSLDRYPLREGWIDVAMLTAAETTREAAAPKGEWRLTQEVDYSNEFDVQFEIIPPRP